MLTQIPNFFSFFFFLSSSCYSDRKNADNEEHPCDSLYYDRNTLPRTTPPPDVVALRAKEKKVREDVAKGNREATTGKQLPPT